MKSFEDVVGVPDCDGDLALEAVAIGGRHGGVAVEFALTGRHALGVLVGWRRVGAVGDKWGRANESALQGAAAGEGRRGREREGEG